MSRYISKFYFLLFFFVTLSYASDVDITGYVRNYMGVLFDDGKYSVVENTLNLNFEHAKDKVHFKTNPFIYQYPGKDLRFGLRELYLDLYFSNIDFRIGKQQIIWGKADGVFITDIVSPKDLTNFLLPDFEEIRLGVTAFKVDYYRGDNTLEFIWLPVFQSTIMPDENSIWYPKLDFPIAPVFDYSKSKVEQSLKNSEVFAKFSALTSRIDFEIMAGYAFDDDPTMHVLKTVDVSSHNLLELRIIPQYHRLIIGGGSFSTTLGPIVLRGEGAFYKDKYFNTLDPSYTDGVVKKDYLHYLIGMDYNAVFDIKLSAQFVQKYILNYNTFIKNDEFDNMATILMKKDFLNETLDCEFFVYYGLNNNDALIRPKIIYDFVDGFSILFGANIFIGDEGMFGQYNNNDMLYTKVKYSF